MDIDKDDLEEKLIEAAEKELDIHNNNEIPMGVLFPPGFMLTYTDYETFEGFLSDSSWEVNNQQDFRDIPNEEFDAYVRENTEFRDWEEMREIAGKEYVNRKTE